MKKHELLKTIDDRELLDKLFGWCYVRTKDSYEAQELCSDIVFAIVKSAHTDGEITDANAFIWRVARNVYADFSANRRVTSERGYIGDPDEAFAFIADERDDYADDADAEELKRIFRSIAFLTRAYREVMIAYYLDGKPITTIAREQNTSETAIRQRLFSARQTIKKEVLNNMENISKPTALQSIDFAIIGTGNPNWGDPRNVSQRQLSKHIVWLCREKARTPAEISDELNVPAVYVEEELDILVAGENGKYGMLRKLDNGRYAINFVLFDEKQIEQAWDIYRSRIPMICDEAIRFISEHEKEYLAYPYLNKQVDLNLVLWQQVSNIAYSLSSLVESNLDEIMGVPKFDRPFSVFGYHHSKGVYFGEGWDGIEAQNVCGYKYLHFDNLYNKFINAHFHCGHNVSNDVKLQLAVRAIDGLAVSSLTEAENEYAAKAIEEGYLFREGDTLYTKFLVVNRKGCNALWDVTNKIDSAFDSEAKKVALDMAEFIKANLPSHLQNEYRLANILADMPVFEALGDELISRGMLTPPQNGVGAEGIWLTVEK